MAELIAIPLKKPSDVDVIKPLTNVIKSTYNSGANQKDYTEAINEFSKLRNNALWRAFEKYESSLEVIYRYESLQSIIYLINTLIHTMYDSDMYCYKLNRFKTIIAQYLSTVVFCCFIKRKTMMVRY